MFVVKEVAFAASDEELAAVCVWKSELCNSRMEETLENQKLVPQPEWEAIQNYRIEDNSKEIQRIKYAPDDQGNKDKFPNKTNQFRHWPSTACPAFRVSIRNSRRRICCRRCSTFLCRRPGKLNVIS